MKKIINKLFEKLGYVPKDRFCQKEEELRRLRLLAENYESYEASLKYCSLVDYHFVQIRKNCYAVYSRDKTTDVSFPIKYFITSKGDIDYTKLCAEELCDMLNEKY
jgi:hypothetical protein